MDQPRATLRALLVTSLIVWIGVWMWLGRYHMLDDAFIHLRYADHLRTTGTLAYNIGEPSYGASSVLYVMLLAALRTFTTSPLLPKVVSTVGYASVFLLIAWQWLRAHGRARVIWILTMLSLCSPVAVRWLADGMETSLTLLVALVFVVMAHRLSHSSAPRGIVTSAIVAASAGLLRVEMSALVFGMSAATVVMATREGASWRSALTRVMPAIAGASLVLVGLQLALGHIVPDTAIAKSTMPFLLGFGDALFRTVEASGSFGVGLCATWLTSLGLVLWDRRAARESWLALIIPNILFPSILFTAWENGQLLQGFRYFAWPLIAALAWNALTLRPPAPSERIATRPFVLAAAMLFVTAWVVEVPRIARVFSVRSATYLAMANARWDGFESARAISGEIGFLGYFSRAYVCDLASLVNGRVAAGERAGSHIQDCVAMGPSIALVTTAEQDGLGIDFSRWTRCGSLASQNMGGVVEHDLLVDPRKVATAPRASGAHPDHTPSFLRSALPAAWRTMQPT